MKRAVTNSGTSKPQRAQPLQPDRPGRGDERMRDDRSPQDAQDKAAAQRAEQEAQALENVRQGYDQSPRSM
jgi:hypothetical protein